jgi:2-polyprenyl-3-methyl-5-hydroxy-6-metoxy-1,4-benzoquinol methylase
VLEFGPGAGDMTKYMKEALHCDVTVIEGNSEMESILGKYAKRVIIADIDVNNWEEKLDSKYDFILWGDVLEHLKYPEKALKKSVLFLIDKGSILTSIPNISHNAIILTLMDGGFNYTKYGLLDDTHIHFFTRKSIYKMMNENGLYSVDEKNTYLTPGRTEQRKYYINKPFMSIYLIFRKDGEVYQFVNKWELKHESNKTKNKNECRSIFTPLFSFFNDLNEYRVHKLHIKFKKSNTPVD